MEAPGQARFYSRSLSRERQTHGAGDCEETGWNFGRAALKTVIPLAERMRVHNNLFAQAAEALIRWQDQMNESKVCLTPVRLGNLMDIIATARNEEPGPS
jgi:hypothetical protein